jgi:hypothetical protein
MSEWLHLAVRVLFSIFVGKYYIIDGKQATRQK